jgi:hypothetical protein
MFKVHTTRAFLQILSIVLLIITPVALHKDIVLSLLLLEDLDVAEACIVNLADELIAMLEIAHEFLCELLAVCLSHIR